jgi:hypothetical protein
MPRGMYEEAEEGGLEEVLMGGSTTRPASPEAERSEAEPEPAEAEPAEAELSRRQRYAYGVGHMFNDLSATCWFSYLLVYLQSVANLSNATAGARAHCGLAHSRAQAPWLSLCLSRSLFLSLSLSLCPRAGL